MGLWVRDLVSSLDIRVTPPRARVNAGTVWSPDNGSIWFVMGGEEGNGIYKKDLKKDGPPDLIEKLNMPTTLSDRNGKFLVYSEINPKTLGDLWYFPIESGKPSIQAATLLLGTAANERHGQISPNGKWLAYRSDEAGRTELYVRSFPKGPGPWPVSHSEPDHNVMTFEPRWAEDGKQLYFLTGTALGAVTLMAVAVDADGRGGLTIGSPKALFPLRAPINFAANDVWSYSPHPDGKRFLVNALVEAGEPTINVITNWQKAVSR
jgi:Tol biopolymer transport system component